MYKEPTKQKTFSVGDGALYGPSYFDMEDKEIVFIVKCCNFLKVADIVIQKNSSVRYRVPYSYLHYL